MKVTSISRKLLTRVLSFYFILTVTVTGIQIVAEYFNTRSHITNELLTLQQTITGSLTRAVWELNTEQAKEISKGMIAIPLVKGITVTDEANNVITQLGESITTAKTTINNSNGSDSLQQSQEIISTSDGLFGHSFPLIFEFSGRTVKVGTVTLLSSNQVIFSRIKIGIYFLIGNAMIKTAFLIFLFTLAFNKLLTNPLYELTEQIKQFDLDDPEASKRYQINYEKNELYILEEAYNNLIEKLIEYKEQLALSQQETHSAKDALDEQNLLLEQEVAKKTSSLSTTMLKMEVQQRELLSQKQALQKENDHRSQTEQTLLKTNKELKKTINELSKAKDRLLSAEKMSSLGELSAEISHEINTPIGVSITSTSYLSDILAELNNKVSNDKLTKRAIEDFINNANHSIELIINNLNRASELILSYKQIAVDQTSDKIREVNIYQYLTEIIRSLQPKLKKTKHEIEIHCPERLNCYFHAGAFAQVMINLLINSLLHGFEHKTHGTITITVNQVDNKIHLHYQDNGQGMPEKDFAHIFDPFYTTKASQGGSGLGTHIIKTLVTDSLNGTIKATNIENEGLSFDIEFPDMRS